MSEKQPTISPITPSTVQVPDQTSPTDPLTSLGSEKKSSPRLSFKKKIPLQMILGVVALFVLVVGAIAAFYLTSKSAELRQQASGGYMECAGGVKDGDKACSGFREVVQCHNGAFAAFKTCNSNERCDKDSSSGCSTLPAQDCNGTPNGSPACDTLHSYVVCRNGLFENHTECGSGRICESGICKGGTGSNPTASIKPSPSVSPSPSLQPVSTKVNCFTGPSCATGNQADSRAACQANGFLTQSECRTEAEKTRRELEAADAARRCFITPDCVSLRSSCQVAGNYSTFDECKMHSSKYRPCYTPNAARNGCDKVYEMSCTGNNYETPTACTASYAPETVQTESLYQISGSGTSQGCTVCTGRNCVSKSACEALVSANLAALSSQLARTAGGLAGGATGTEETNGQAGPLSNQLNLTRQPGTAQAVFCWEKPTCQYKTNGCSANDYSSYNVCTAVRDANLRPLATGSLTNAIIEELLY